jgi:hemolysin activation/secretion protein
MYVREEVTRLTRLPHGASWSVRIEGQLSNHSLLNTEQLSAGGPDLLRGYDPYSVLGDQGIIISNELRTPPLHVKRNGERPLWGNLLDQTQFLTFWDYANLHNRHAGGGIAPNINASSVGMGLRYSLRSYAALKVDYGWQLQRLPDANNRGHLLSFGVIIGN